MAIFRKNALGPPSFQLLIIGKTSDYLTFQCWQVCVRRRQKTLLCLLDFGFIPKFESLKLRCFICKSLRYLLLGLPELKFRLSYFLHLVANRSQVLNTYARHYDATFIVRHAVCVHGTHWNYGDSEHRKIPLSDMKWNKETTINFKVVLKQKIIKCRG